MDKLHEFYNDKAMQHAVKVLFTETMEEYIITRAMNGQDVSAAPQVKKILQDSFTKLELKYQPKKQTPKKKDGSV